MPIHATDSDDHCIDYWEEQDIPAELQAYRKQLKADYGKIDYVLRDGHVVVFDINRTPSSGNIQVNALYSALFVLLLGKRSIQRPLCFVAGGVKVS